MTSKPTLHKTSQIDEVARLAALKNYKILDTAAEKAFDRLTELAATFYQSPIALVSLVDEERQWFKSRVGIDAPETPRDISFCQHAIKSDQPFIVNDAQNDDRFKDNPLVTGGPKIRFYAGAPLKSPSGHRIGTLCVIDSEPRDNFSFLDSKQLQLLADIVISEMELRLSNAQLTQAMRSQSDFLSMISHEIRNPLGAIIGLADTLTADEMDSKKTMAIKGIQSSSRVLMGLLNDVLDFTKSKVDKIILNRSATDLHILFDTCAEIWDQTARDKGVKLELTRADDLPRVVRLDELRVNQILNNLISNALKFTNDGGVKIIVSMETTGPKGALLKIQVKDTGIGMSENQQATLFNPFEQADKTISRRFGGTGLGMAITNDLITLMAGEIKCTSIENIGTTFDISIPVQITKIQQIHSTPEQIHNILVVDDVDLNLIIVEGLIKKLDHKVTTANGGKLAVELATSNAFDLILMDIHMPVIDGAEAARQIRKVKPAQKIIALSADDPQDLTDSELGSLFDDFLTKPVSLEGLLESIDKHGDLTDAP